MSESVVEGWVIEIIILEKQTFDLTESKGWLKCLLLLRRLERERRKMKAEFWKRHDDNSLLFKNCLTETNDSDFSEISKETILPLEQKLLYLIIDPLSPAFASQFTSV